MADEDEVPVAAPADDPAAPAPPATPDTAADAADADPPADAAPLPEAENGSETVAAGDPTAAAAAEADPDPGDTAETDQPVPADEPVPADAVAVPEAAVDAAPAAAPDPLDLFAAVAPLLGDAVGALLEPLHTAVAAVEAKVAEVARLGDRHNQIIDELHRENQRLRQGELGQALSPILRDLVRLVDQLAQLDEASGAPGTSDAAIAARQVSEILARAGVEPFVVEVGDEFDAALHQGIGRRPTADEAAHNRVATVRRAGWAATDGRVLRAAEVEVHRFEAPASAAVPAEPAEPAVPPAPVAVPPPEPPPVEASTEPPPVEASTEPVPVGEAATEPAPPPQDPAPAPAGDDEGAV